MSQDHAPDDFDWVDAQAKCTPAAMFERLKKRVREDVQRRNGMLGRNDGWKFEFHEDGDQFEASRVAAAAGRGATGSAVVQFARAGRRIHVQGDGIDLDFSAVVTLDATGVCRFVVGEAFYSDWEIRRMALEQLFFDEDDLE
jgi:hypothetical protein